MATVWDVCQAQGLFCGHGLPGVAYDPLDVWGELGERIYMEDTELKTLFTIENPTIKDLVEKLLTLDQEKKIVIEDADTDWEIKIIHFKEEDGKVLMFGEYYEMHN